jgi:ribonuclease III family protein
MNLPINAYAYLGDAYLALVAKTYLVSQGVVKSKELSQQSIRYLSAQAQADFIVFAQTQPWFDETMKQFFLKGRNYKSDTIPKNASVITYRLSTGCEAVFGYYYSIQDQETLNQLWDYFKTFVQEKYETISLR